MKNIERIQINIIVHQSYEYGPACLLRDRHLALAVLVAEVPLNVDSSERSVVGERVPSSVRQVNAVSRRAARAGILDGGNDSSASTANTIVATGVLDEDLAAAVLGRPAVALPAGGKGNNQLVVTVELATRSGGTILIVDGTGTPVAGSLMLVNLKNFTKHS